MNLVNYYKLNFNYENREDFKNSVNKFKLPIVVKADGLAAGKGVVICKTKKKAFEISSPPDFQLTLGAWLVTVKVDNIQQNNIQKNIQKEIKDQILLDGKAQMIYIIGQSFENLLK